MRAVLRSALVVPILIGILTVPAAPPADAAFYRWVNPDGGTWETDTNWDQPGYPRLFFDFALFDLDTGYGVIVTDPALVAAIGGITVAGGNVTLDTHSSFEAGLAIGIAGVPAALTIHSGVIDAMAPHTVGADGSLTLGSGAVLRSRATGTYGFAIDAGGLLCGEGTLEGQLLRSLGTVDPGAGPGEAGVLTIGGLQPGGYLQGNAAALHIDVTGSGHDRLAIADGSLGVTIGGVLEVTFGPGFTPAGEQRFEILTASAYDGTFAIENLPSVPGVDVAVAYEPSAVVLVVTAAAVSAPVTLDLQPGACPNPLNVNKRGVVPAALAGSAEFDVTQIDVATLLLEGVAPTKIAVGDVTSPLTGEPCVCEDLASDGIPDLKLKFPAPALAAALGTVVDGQEATLTLTGALLDGTPFSAEDCVVIHVPGNGQGKKNSKSADAGVTAKPGALRPLTSPREPVQRVSYALDQSGAVRLSVFDVAGRLVAVPVDGVEASGTRTASWDASRVPGGIYFYLLETEAGVTRAKTLVLRR